MTSKRAQASLPWWIIAFIMMSAVFGVITWLGVSTYSVHSSFYDVQKDILFERGVQSVQTQNLLSGQQDFQLPFSQDDVAGLDVSHDFTLKVEANGQVYFTNQTQFEDHNSRVPVVYERRIVQKQLDNQSITITIIQPRTT